MTSTNINLLSKYLFVSFLFLSLIASAQTDEESAPVTVYNIKVILQNGQRYRGTIGQVTEKVIRVEDDPELILFPYSGAALELSDIKRVVIRPNLRRSARIKGVIVGGLAGLYLGLVHAPPSTFRSPTFFGINLAMVIGAGAAAGGLTGHLIGNTKRVVIYAVGSDPDVRVRQLRIQLEPYSYIYQGDIYNRAIQQPNK